MRLQNPDRQAELDGLPDFRHINQIPILEAARRIGLEVESGKIVCPRAEKHPNGSSSLLKRLPKNKVKCDVCGTVPLGVVDLMMFCGDFDSPREAVLRLGGGLGFAMISKGLHLKNPGCLSVPPTCEDPIGLLVKSGIWSALSEPVHSLIPVMLNLAQWGEPEWNPDLYISYGALMTYSGISSPNAISHALTEMADLEWLERLGSTQRGDSPIRGTALYRLTPLSAKIRELANQMAPAFADQIMTQKAARKLKREAREAVLNRPLHSPKENPGELNPVNLGSPKESHRDSTALAAERKAMLKAARDAISNPVSIGDLSIYTPEDG